jgi:hypothetical protein
VNDALQNFGADTSRPVATSPDQSRQAATDDTYLSIKEAQEIFSARGRAMTERTLQRYCDKRRLDGQKRMTNEGEKWFVTKSSVLRCIRELEDFEKLKLSRQVATGRDTSAPVAPDTAPQNLPDNARQAATDHDVSAPVAEALSHATSPDMSRQDATGRDVSLANETRNGSEKSFSDSERELYERMIAMLTDQTENLITDKEVLLKQLEAKDVQLAAKDKQIDRFFESERDTKTLAGRLQSLMSALWPKKDEQLGERYVPMHESLESGLPEERREHER